MALILMLCRNWTKSYGILRYRNGLGLLASLRYGLWLARGYHRNPVTIVHA